MDGREEGRKQVLGGIEKSVGKGRGMNNVTGLLCDSRSARSLRVQVSLGVFVATNPLGIETNVSGGHPFLGV